MAENDRRRELVLLLRRAYDADLRAGLWLLAVQDSTKLQQQLLALRRRTLVPTQPKPQLQPWSDVSFMTLTLTAIKLKYKVLYLVLILLL